MRRMIAWLFALAALAYTDSAEAQSFNCRKAYFADERLICNSPELSKLDEQLDWVYRQNMNLLSRAERRALDREEENWVIARRRCGRHHGCIEAAYRSRIHELAVMLRDELGHAPARPRAERRERRNADEPASPAGEGLSREAETAASKPAAASLPDRKPRATAAMPEAKREAERDEATRPRSSGSAEVIERQAPPQPSEQPASASGSTRAPSVEWVNPPPAR